MKTPKSQEELESLTVHQLRSLDIDSQEEEHRVQAVLNKKLQNTAVEQQVYRGDIPDIKTKEDELKWQKVIDERENSLRPKDKIQETSVDLGSVSEEELEDEDEEEKTEEELEEEIDTLTKEKEELVPN